MTVGVARPMRLVAGMNTRALTLALTLVLAVSVASDLAAQRRTTGGGSTPSGGRSTPSAGGSTRSSGSSGSRASGSSRGSSSAGSSRGTPRGSSGSSGAYRDRSGSSRPSASSRSGSNGRSSATTTSTSRPRSGKIGDIRNRAVNDRARGRVIDGVYVGPGIYVGGGPYYGGCWDCGYWGWYGRRWGWYQGPYWYPAEPIRRTYDDEDNRADEGGQGYMDYPYAVTDGTGDTFVRRHGGERRGFGALTVTYFNDVGSTTQAGSIAFEGAIRGLRGEAEYAHYAEPVQGGTDHLRSLRGAIAIQPRLGERAFLVAGAGARAIFLDNGQSTVGPEGTLGLQVFPVRPLGAAVTGRVAALSWNGHDYFALRELNTTGSVFLGRFELQGGWHWMKLGGSPAFGGPIAAVKVWF